MWRIMFFHPSLLGVIYHIILFPIGCGARISPLRVKYDRFTNGDEGNWEKHLVPFPQYKIADSYIQVCP